MMLINERQSCVNLWYSPVNGQCEQRLVKNNEDFSLFYNTMSVLPRQKETLLPEVIAKSHDDLPSDAGVVFFITSQLRKEFVSNLSSIDLFKNKKLRILLVDSDDFSEEQKKLAESVATASATELWRIDRNNLAASLNYAIELNQKR